jgi:hypothetical protein
VTNSMEKSTEISGSSKRVWTAPHVTRLGIPQTLATNHTGFRDDTTVYPLQSSKPN